VLVVLLSLVLAVAAETSVQPAPIQTTQITADYSDYLTGQVNPTPAVDENQDPVMNLSDDEMDAMQREIDAMPVYSAPSSSPLISRGSLSLLPDLPYVPKERSQRQCSDCWVWSSTGAIEIEHTIKSGIRDRLSIQYLNDNYGNGPQGQDSGCCPGSVGSFVKWYRNNTHAMIVVPWSNSNAAFAAHQSCNSPMPASGAIPLQPSYKLADLSASTVSTFGVEKIAAINNIKSALNNGLPVLYAFNYNTDDMKTFKSWWHNQPETAVFDPSRFASDGGGAAHLTLIVGYDDITDPKNPYWLVVNSWGAPPNRPDGTFRISMNMNYNAPVSGKQKANVVQQQSFHIIDASFADSGQNVSPVLPSPESTPRLDLGILPVFCAICMSGVLLVRKRREQK